MRFSSRRSAFVAACALAVAVVVVYAPALDRVPPYLHHDEVFFALQAEAIALTGRDTNGRFLPVFFEVFPGSWFQPILVYFSALVLKVLPLSELAIRLPTVFVAAADVVLLLFVARRTCESVSFAVAGAAILLLTPAHFIHARLAMDYLYPVPFVLGWVLLLDTFWKRRDSWLLAAATLCLGIGVFSYIAAMAMMPIYLAITVAFLWLTPAERPRHTIPIALAGFLAPVLVGVAAVASNPDIVAAKWRAYGAAGGRGLNALQQLSELLNYGNVASRVSLYFDFFNGGYLFLSGGSNILNSTRHAGVFLLPCAVFIPVGIYQALRRRSRLDLLVCIGFATAPLAALIVFESGAIDRELELLPFGALLAAGGLRYLWFAPTRLAFRRVYVPIALAGAGLALVYAAFALARHRPVGASTLPLLVFSAALVGVGALTDRTRSWRPVAATLAVFAVVEFAAFYRDYMTDYRLRAIGHFEWNRRAACEAIIARENRDRPSPVLISEHLQYVDASWRLYAQMFGRPELRSLARFINPEKTDRADLPPDAFVLTFAGADADRAFAERARLVPVATIAEPDGTTSFAIWTTGSRRRLGVD